MRHGFLGQYPLAADRFDEMLDGRGVPRSHWRKFLDELESLSPDAARVRERFVRESIEADGITYNVYADPKGHSRPWELDLLPLILPVEEWRKIEAAISQRARVLDAVLADLYGPQQLLAEGLLPPALIYGQHGYLWPCHGVKPPGGHYLHVYAADLARSPDGSWWVIADRTQGPSGAGYALQNRSIVSRAFPDAYREAGVQQLARFFGALQSSLHRMAPIPAGESPLVVLLTPGPYNETYFEHSFLARHLGFPLVEGQDLTVRGDAVYMKTLRGLRRVHAILRRLDDDFCDPVELRPDSALGIPGLLHAVRSGNVLVANALGSGVLETGSLLGFLPAISERLTGEKLAMPAVATWWCGEEPALEYAIEHLDELVIKPAYPSMRREAIFGHRLANEERERMIERLRAQPHAYVAQEWVRLSRAPTVAAQRGSSDRPRKLAPRAVGLRVFAVATREGYVVMPGALTRVSQGRGDVVSMQRGGSSKDTWVLGGEPVAKSALLKTRIKAADVIASAVDQPSRVGENLFWMGRYAERCEGVARLLRAALGRVAETGPNAAQELTSIAVVCAHLDVVDLRSTSDEDAPVAPSSSPSTSPPPSPSPSTSPSPSPSDDAPLDELFLDAVADPRVTGGLAANVLRLQHAAGQVRERMSTDNWHVFNRLPQRLPQRRPSLGAALEALDEIMLACVSLAGFAMDDMTRDESWRFLILGRRLERLAHLAGVVERVLRFGHDERIGSLEWLLEAANCIVTYRSRYRRAPELLPVAHLVLFDRTNPHSIAFQTAKLRADFERAAAELGTVVPSESISALDDAVTEAARDLVELEHAPGAELESACAELASLAERCKLGSFAISDELGRHFFSHAGTFPTISGAHDEELGD